MPAMTGTEGIIHRNLAGLCVAYLAGLSDLAVPDPEVLARLAGELVEVCSRTHVRRVQQLIVAGVRPSGRLEGPHGVRLRGLTATERGALMARQLAGTERGPADEGELAIPGPGALFNPTAVIEVVSDVPKGAPRGPNSRMAGMCLAFFLSGFSVEGLGWVSTLELPRWASSGTTSQPFALGQRSWPGESRPITAPEFEAVVELAERIPDFSAEANGQEIALSRVLRGCAGPDSGLLDFSIALEAALLGDASTELAYRFALFGALFLAEELDPTVTFKRLSSVYRIRSKLVHGSHVPESERQAAEHDAGELAKAVVRRAVEKGWPSRKRLEREVLELASGRH